MGKPKALKDKLFGAAVIKMSFVLRGDGESPAFKYFYPGVLRDLELTDEAVEKYIEQNRESVEKVLGYNALARKEGGIVLLDGGEMQVAPGGKGCYLSPFVYVIEAKPGLRTIREEVFGPHVALIPFKDDEQAVRIANDTDYGLSMAVITESYRKMRFFRDECEYGMGYVNLPCIGAEVHLPFGGVKKSGNGHPSAAGLIETVTHKTAWTVNHAEQVKMAQGLTTDIAGGGA